MTVKIAGQLEIDKERGVIYFHSGETGITLLRVCNLPRPIRMAGGLIDIIAREIKDDSRKPTLQSKKN